MFKFFIIFLLSISVFTFAPDDIDIEVDIKIEKTLYKNGIKNGEMVKYYENGNLKVKALYIDGKLDGVVKQYYKHGTLIGE